jgi:ankyrin repeat protein
MRGQGAEDGWTALHLAAHYGRPGVVRLLIEAGADVNALADNIIGNTPLMAAIAGGNEAIVRELIAAGADPYKKDRNGRYDTISLTQAEGRAALAAVLKEALARAR